jgi:CspA family cold shock protein
MVERGVCKWFNDKKGWGFILDDKEAEIFCHYTNIVGEGHKSILEGDTVEFVRVVGEKGVKADKVRVVCKA